jgi:hypothetical protein
VRTTGANRPAQATATIPVLTKPLASTWSSEPVSVAYAPDPVTVQNRRPAGSVTSAAHSTGVNTPATSRRAPPRPAPEAAYSQSTGSSTAPPVCFVRNAHATAAPAAPQRRRSAHHIAAAVQGRRNTSKVAACASSGFKPTEISRYSTPAVRPDVSPQRRRAREASRAAVRSWASTARTRTPASVPEPVTANAAS